ncbi:MAG: hypothetical protein KDA85_20775, partial [Planctomycetaceae bacterium]|nr:hypothetical protein [Planctomycetaceae bacterium]
MISRISLLAQADKPLDATIGQIVSGLLVLGACFFSLLMMGWWIYQTLHFGHPLPAARRGILRVHPIVMGLGVAIAGLMLIMALASSVMDAVDTTEVPLPATAQAEQAVGESAVVPDAGEAQAAAENETTSAE